MSTRTILRCFSFLAVAAIASAEGFRPADDDELPFQVSVKDLRQNRFLCSGVLITPSSVLSAGVCVAGQEFVKVSGGSSVLPMQNFTSHSTEIVLHPNYTEGKATFHPAIIRLADPLPRKYLHPAKVPVDGTSLANRTYFSGWSVVNPKPSLFVLENYTVWRNCREKFNLSVGPDEFCGEDFEDADGLRLDQSVVSKDGVVYGLQTGVDRSRKAATFLRVSGYEFWIRRTLGKESVEWHVDFGRNRGVAPSGCVAATLLLTLFRR